MRARILTIILGILWTGVSVAQNDMGRFTNYTIKEGLSQSTVLDIFQDKKGFLWFGTADGLNKFDGQNFTVYKNNYKDPNSLSDNMILKVLLEDSDNNLWIITGDRVINKFNLQTQQFQRYKPIIGNTKALFQFQNIFSATEDLEKNLWISTNLGLIRYDAQSKNIRIYNPFKSKDSLKNQEYFLISFKDSKGNLWLWSFEGLCKYNYKKNSFEFYQENNKTNGSLLSNKIIRIIETDDKQLWILTTEGLSLYNYQTNNFISYPFPEKIDFYLLKTIIPSALADKQGNIWIATTKQGLIKFDTKKNEYKIYNNLQQPKGSISDNRITKIAKDNSGGIWVGTVNGLNLYNPSNNSFINFYHENKMDADNYVSDIIILHNSEIWTLGREQHMGYHISKLNRRTGYLDKIENNSCNPNTIASTLVYRPFIDLNGNLWLSSFNNGVIKYSPRTNKFKHFYHSPNDPKSIEDNDIWGFTEDLSGNIWVSNCDRVLSKLDTITGTFTNYTLEIKNKKNLQFNLMNLVTGKDGNIWIATIGSGLIRFNPATGDTKAYLNDPDNPNSISSNRLHMILIDNYGKIWIANGANGVDIFDPATETFKKLRNDPNNTNSLSNNNIWAIAKDKQHNIWIAAEGYIDCYSPATNKYVHYKSKEDINSGILADKALCIFCDSRGDMWFGTSGGGLSKLDKQTNKFTHFTEMDGLANNVVYGIIEDNQNNLWLSTNRGISKFSKETHSFTNYYESAGVQSNEFNQNAYFKSSTNQIYLGGINGFNSFNPNDIIQDTITPKTILIGFQISGKHIPVLDAAKQKLTDKKRPGSTLIFDKSGYYLPIDAPYLKEIVIPYHAKVFTLEFASDSYNTFEKGAFRYKMENFDTDWNYASDRNYATYTNLPAGEYIFKVSAANGDGYWNPNAYELKITIVPPFWKTWWFITLILLSVASLIWLFIFLRLRNLKKSKGILESKIKERTRQIAEKNEELELRNIEISKQKEEITFQAKQLKSELILQNKVSETALLRSQINPHFLFNTLNNLYSLAYSKSEDAPSAIMKLSEIMRYMLYEANVDKVPLEKEINYLKSFIELQLLRTKNKDFIEFNIIGNIYGKSITPMIFIPFIENAFKHGSKKNGNPGIIINLVIKEGTLYFNVSNQYQSNGSVNKDQTGGIGLVNVRRRLELIHPNEHILEITKNNGQFKVSLELPLL